MLHVTPGDSIVEGIRRAGIRGYMVPWKDVLHEGPVPAGLSPEALREIRAGFISERGWGARAAVLGDFKRRDDSLAAFREHDEVVLWFESDLLDQLQLVQVLDLFAERALGATKLTFVDGGDLLSRTGGEGMNDFFVRRRALSVGAVGLARRAWTAFRSPDPTGIVALLREDTSALPHLAAALKRHLQQFPAALNGLSRSEQQILEAVAAGRSVLREMHRASHHDREEKIFLGDTVFASYVEGLSAVKEPLLVHIDGGPLRAPRRLEDEEIFWKSRARLTDEGYSVLEGKKDWIKINGADRWLGGVYLVGETIAWRWNEPKQQLQRTGVYG